MNKKIVLIIASILILGGAFFWGAKSYKAQQNEKLAFIAENNFSAFVKPHSPRYGKSEAKVYLVEFFDPECESCRAFNPYVKKIISKFDGKVQLVLRYAPFHRNSVFVVKILEASKKQDKYWETLGLLFESQPYWADHHNPRPDLIWGYLPSIGVDIEKIKKDMEDSMIGSIIEADIKDGKDLGVNGTPTFFVNGKILNEFSEQGLENAVAEAVKKNYE